MTDKIVSIAYDLDGAPFTLVSERYWREAIRSGRLTRTTEVEVYRVAGSSRQPAGDVPELCELFDQLEAMAAAVAAAAAAAAEARKARPSPPEPDPKPRRKRRIQPDNVPGVDIGPHAPPPPPWPEPDPLPQLNRRAAFVVGPVIALLLLAGLSAFLRRPERVEPLPAVTAQAQEYRIIPPVNLRRHPTSRGVPAKTLWKELTLKATFDDRSPGTWLRVTEGDYAGFYIWAGNVELESK